MRNLSFVVLLFLFPIAALAVTPATFKQALPGYEYSFPRDFYSHDDYRIEWWYYTGNLREDASDREFGYQLTFFRVALDPNQEHANPSQWKIDQIYFAHMTVTDVEGESFHFFERINRPALELAGADSDKLNIWNEDWSLTSEGKTHRLVAKENGIGIDLTLTPAKPMVFHGENGVSQKGEGLGNASHYFSFTRMTTQGTVSLKGHEYRVSGTSWMDREYSSNQLNKNQIGWDWFSLKFDDGAELMLYQIRLKTGGIDPFSSGTYIDKDGTAHPLKREQFNIRTTGTWVSEHLEIVYPSGWEIRVPSKKLKLKIEPDIKDQELYALRSINRSYWEGSVSINGREADGPLSGKGYVELVGYGKALEQHLPD